MQGALVPGLGVRRAPNDPEHDFGIQVGRQIVGDVAADRPPIEHGLHGSDALGRSEHVAAALPLLARPTGAAGHLEQVRCTDLVDAQHQIAHHDHARWQVHAGGHGRGRNQHPDRAGPKKLLHQRAIGLRQAGVVKADSRSKRGPQAGVLNSLTKRRRLQAERVGQVARAALDASAGAAEDEHRAVVFDRFACDLSTEGVPQNLVVTPVAGLWIRDDERGERHRPLARLVQVGLQPARDGFGVSERPRHRQ